MNRGNFIKSMTLLIVSPKILSEISKSKRKLLLKKNEYWFKITPEMEQDSAYLTHALSNNGFIYKNASLKGIDMNKEFEFKVGFSGDDFAMNMKTGTVSQYYKSI